MEATATDASGRVTGELKDDRYECVAVGWIKSVVLLDLERVLESGFQEMEETAPEGTRLERGELVQTTKSGHRMIYRYYNLTTQSEVYYGILGAWQCDVGQRLCMLHLMYGEEDVLPVYQRYLDSFVCHG